MRVGVYKLEKTKSILEDWFWKSRNPKPNLPRRKKKKTITSYLPYLGIRHGGQEACTVNVCSTNLEKYHSFVRNMYFAQKNHPQDHLRIHTDQLRFLLDTPPAKLQNISDGILWELQYLQNRAFKTANQVIPYIRRSEEVYFKTIGPLLMPGQWNLRYKSRETKTSLRSEPLPCDSIMWMEKESDACLSELMGTRDEENRKCIISEECFQMMTAPRFKGYPLTHEVLYLQVGEMNGCLPLMEKLSSKGIAYLRDSRCADVMRDAQEMEQKGFPIEARDLFMEQIGLCGLFGYGDFFKPKWLEAILEWQRPSGCYEHPARYVCTDGLQDKTRIKREDRKLKDGCSSHMTSVAVLALVMEIRFCIENYEPKSRSTM